ITEQLDELLQPQSLRDAWAVFEQLPPAVGGGRDYAKAARARGDERLEGDVVVRVPELPRRGVDRGGAGGATPGGPADADRVEQRIRLRLVVRAAYGFGAGDEQRRLAEPLLVLGERQQLEGRLRQDGVDPLEPADLDERVGEAGVAPRRNEVEGVAEVAADRQLGHVGADETHFALAVLAQRPDQCRAARDPRRRQENRQRPHVKSIRSSASRARSRSRSASSIASIVSRIVAPG